MATHSNVLAWRIPGTEEPGGASVYGIAQSQTRLMRLSSSSSSSRSCLCLLGETQRLWLGVEGRGFSEKGRVLHTTEDVKDCPM